ncbi:DeoR/GlpR family DNA-binding transcription regulator [Jiangella alba]|uniref:DNA-binding transcriptional regulator of sugar metabolism, DeoR/GlpR family n=1 Tax=Jiangella alba TaxID=561176 RepID=A0A1H5IW56_9ACTN|nr:DeoR/GlpR family DNA-binding transcription regulator [Jiangella alba]SEE44394.1 DNA-binding transcriptional regulator of sugar metabolism, DeoR/GlpR family [Jiangella alba]
MNDRLTARDRRRAIVDMAWTDGRAGVGQLAAHFGVTESTIRRDLALLTSQGQLARTYGGAMAHGLVYEASLGQRAREGFRQKQAIAAWAAEQIGPGETVLLDAGTTTGQLARELREREQLTVVTIGLTVLNELADADGVDVLCLGGRLRHISQGLVGPFAEAALERVTADRAFLGADAVTVENGICEANLEQTRLKEMMMTRAEQVYVLADASKLGQRPFHAWARMPATWTLVTDDGAPPAEVERFRAAGVEVIVTGTKAAT